MSIAPTATAASDRLLHLIARIEALPDFAEVVESLQAGHAATLDGVWGSSSALVAAALARAAPAVLVVVCPRLEEDSRTDRQLEPLFFATRRAVSRVRIAAGRKDGSGRGGRRSSAAC